MSRLFDGVNDVMAYPAPAALNGAITQLAVVKFATAAGFASIIEVKRSGGAGAASIGRNPNEGENLYWAQGASSLLAGGVTLTDTTNWLVIAITKAAGTTTPRAHRVIAGGGSPTHTDQTGTLGNGDDATGGTLRLGGADDFANIRLAAAAVWHGTALTDGQIEGIATAKTTASIAALSPTWLVDDSDGFANDLVGTAHRSAIVDTADDADDPAGWVYGLGAADPYIGAGAAATAASGNVTPALPGSLATNDALVLEITALDNVNCSVAVSGGAGNAWTRKTAHNNGTGLRQEIWWKRRGASDADTHAAVTHTAGSKIIARVHAIRVPGTGDPFEATGGPTSVAAAATGTFPNVTTVTDDAFLFYAFSYAEDFTTGPAISNAQGLTLTERDETEVS